MEVGFKSDKGICRSNNEDACFVLLPENIYLVADGVGGGNSGEIASRTAVNEIGNYVKSHPIKEMETRDQIVGYLQVCLKLANKKIFNLSKTYQENTGMATTIAMVYVRNKKAYIANIGDSRVYAYRAGKLQQLTEDHTYVHTLVKAGILTELQASVDERKNVITKALGAEGDIEPDYYQVEIQKGDVILICTDGLYDEVSNLEIEKVILESGSMSEVVSSLVREANKNGGRDNITVIGIKVTEDE